MASTDATVFSKDDSKIIETFCCYSNKCSNYLMESYQCLQSMNESNNIGGALLSSLSINNTTTKTIQYAPIGVVYSGGVAVADISQQQNSFLVSSSSDDDNNKNYISSDSDSSSSSSIAGSTDNDDDGSLLELNDPDVTKSSISNVTSSTNQPVLPLQQKKPQNNNKIKNKKLAMNAKQYESLIRKHWETVPVIRFMISQPKAASSSSNSNNNVLITSVLELPSALLSKQELSSSELTNIQRCESYQRIVGINYNSSTNTKSYIVVLFLRSGRFAGGVFSKSTSMDDDVTKRSQNCCLAHRTSVRYTIRKGQGKAQSTQDGQRKPKSMGAQLRRAGEINLYADVATIILDWKQYIMDASYILISIPKTMQKNFYTSSAVADGTKVCIDTVFQKHDTRIRRIPLDVGRPSYESVCLIHTIMTTAVVRQCTILDTSRSDSDNDQIKTNSSASDADAANDKLGNDTSPEVPTYPSLSPLHVAAQECNVDVLKQLLSSSSSELLEEWKNQRAGEFYMTPLHLATAAASTAAVGPSSSATTTTSPAASDYVPPIVDATIAAEFITILLEEMKCNPCIVDVRNRVPYFLASHDKVRDAFRMARANLGEEYCEWDAGGKVGPPLTQQDIQLKKEKEAEKKRKKRQRLKEKKEQDKIKADELRQHDQLEEERKQKEEDAKRIRDGLQPKKATSAGGIVCDFCQTIVTGRKARTQMFQRLDYMYCTAECVQKHKRELMANAAASRFGG